MGCFAGWKCYILICLVLHSHLFGTHTVSSYRYDISNSYPVLRTRDVYPGSDFFPSRIPDSNCLHPGSRIRIKEFKYFNPKKWFLSPRKYDPGCSSRIQDPDADFLPIPDPGVKKAPDPGSGSATLVMPLLKRLFCYCLVQRWIGKWNPGYHTGADRSPRYSSDLVVEVGGPGEGGHGRGSLTQGGRREHGQQVFPVFPIPPHHVQGTVGSVLPPSAHTALLIIINKN
jgi:hypothetical protein